MTDKDKQVDLLPCPFCGSKIDTEECPYPSGSTWRYWGDEEKEYGSHRQFENQCLKIVCQCGAVLEGDTEDELITLWNTRPRAGSVILDMKLNELELLAEDLECVQMWLDDKKAPKINAEGKEYSVVGRIQCLLN